MLLSGTACFCKRPEYPHGTADRILQRMLNQLDKDPQALLDSFHQNVHAPQKPSRQKKDASPPNLPALRAGLEYLQQTDLRPLIPTFPLPVLILHGTHDQIIPIQAAQWLHEHLPESQLIPFEGLGHALPAHAFERVMQAAEHFLA
jgi:pimeloyl-[acyl-carrier protein] methyl ester esterase